MSYEVRIRRVFSAAHQVRMPDGRLEPVHGHDWEVTLTVGRATLDATGFVVDFHDLERHLDPLIAQLNNTHLNENPITREVNPTAENIATLIAGRIVIAPPAALLSVEITEAPNCSAVWRRD